MQIAPFELERWQSIWENKVELNVSESGVEPMNVRELLEGPGSVETFLDTRLGYPQTNGTEEWRNRIASFYPGWDSNLVGRLCDEWNIDTRARIKSMSTGERQKLSIVLAFGQRPDLLVLDEPVASLDPIARRQFLEQLVELSSDAQRAVVFSSHIVSDIERLANRIWILKEGRLDWQGALDSLKDFGRLVV